MLRFLFLTNFHLVTLTYSFVVICFMRYKKLYFSNLNSIVLLKNKITLSFSIIIELKDLNYISSSH